MNTELTLNLATTRNSFVRATRFALLIVGILALPLAPQAALVTATWNGGVGNWTDAGNWDVGVVPNNGTDSYDVRIDGGKTGVASHVTLTMPGVNYTVDSLEIDAGDTLRLTTSGGAPQFRSMGTLTNNGTLEWGPTMEELPIHPSSTMA